MPKMHIYHALSLNLSGPELFIHPSTNSCLGGLLLIKDRDREFSRYMDAMSLESLQYFTMLHPGLV